MSASGADGFERFDRMPLACHEQRPPYPMDGLRLRDQYHPCCKDRRLLRELTARRARVS
jgi:hypothetical protein